MQWDYFPTYPPSCRTHYKFARTAIIIRCKFFFFFHYPRAHHVTCIYLPTNNGLLKRNVVQLCFAANNLLLIRKKQRTFLLLAIAFAWKWQKWQIFIIELGYRKISWFFSLLVDQLWSARHWQITIFCSTSSNNCRPIIVFTIKVLVEPSDDIIYWA